MTSIYSSLLWKYRAWEEGSSSSTIPVFHSPRRPGGIPGWRKDEDRGQKQWSVEERSLKAGTWTRHFIDFLLDSTSHPAMMSCKWYLEIDFLLWGGDAMYSGKICWLWKEKNELGATIRSCCKNKSGAAFLGRADVSDIPKRESQIYSASDLCF